MNSPLVLGFLFIFIAAVAGGAFGLQYRIMRLYTVENASWLSVFVATVPIPLVACSILLPGWTEAIAQVGFGANVVVFLFGFCWGLGAITYAYGFSILGMALAASLLKGISIAIGAGVPLLRHWDQVASPARAATIVGLAILTLGTTLAGKAGIMREKEARGNGAAVSRTVAMDRPTTKLFWIGLMMCLFSGVASSGANLGYDRADVIEKSMVDLAQVEALNWRATLVRWMPMYWGGITALTLFMGGAALRNGTWRNFFAEGSLHDFLISSSMGAVHFLAQIPYGIGAFYLGNLGTTVGWGANIGMALVVATGLGFFNGEWKGSSRAALQTLYFAIAILITAIAVLAYANGLA
jgi:L-rhamnose-H+ transport protein